jgi:hypothetical protein
MKCFYCNKIINGSIYMGYDHQFCCDDHRWNYITSKEKFNIIPESENDIGYDYSKDIVNIQESNIKKVNIKKANIICIPFLNKF